MYKFDEKPLTHFSKEAKKAMDLIKVNETSILAGKNNCGKSYLLKTLNQHFGSDASYFGPSRYQNFNVLGSHLPDKRRNKKVERYVQFTNLWQNETQNIDNNQISLQESIAELKDPQRKKLFLIIRKLLKVKLQILYTDPDNKMSQKYIACGSHNISFASSGIRLITALLTCLLDINYNTFLIDEPELGISPETQGILADFIFKPENRKKYFPHIKHLIMATHSTIFLDRWDIKNNYSVSKTGDIININPTLSILDFNNIQFFLLGNRLEHLYLPSCIVLTEGDSDQRYLSKILHSKFPFAQLSVINCNSDSRMKDIIFNAASLFTDLQKSPYRTRILAVLDKKHDSSVPPTLVGQGIPADNIIIWKKNGIEFYYPEEILNDIFGIGGDIQINDELVVRNELKYKKTKLCDEVLKRINKNSKIPTEVEEKLFRTVERVIGN